MSPFNIFFKSTVTIHLHFFRACRWTGCHSRAVHTRFYSLTARLLWKEAWVEPI